MDWQVLYLSFLGPRINRWPVKEEGQDHVALEVHREARITSLSKEGPGDGGPVRLPEKY